MLVALLAITLALLTATLALPRALVMPQVFWVHLLVAVGIMTLIVASMQHFVPVLTRSRGAGRAMAKLPFWMLAAGALVTAIFAGWPDYRFVTLAAGMGLTGVAILSVWMLGKWRATLGRPHPCLDWYLGALACLALGLAAAAAMPWLPLWHDALRAFHVHINLYGFVGLTAIGTLQVLFPTAAGKPDPDVARRLRTDLKWALAGSLLLALGAAGPALVKPLGLLAWLWPLGRLAWSWGRLYRPRVLSLHGVEPILAAALIGFVSALILAAFSSPERPLALFLPAFLMPLVSGAAGQLAPVWARSGVATPWHAESRRLLGLHGGIRALLFLAVPLISALGYECIGMPALTALIWFLVLFAIWLWRD